MRCTVDPGHGGKDPGAVSNGIRESDIVLVYADALATELRRRGHSVLQTRTGDEFVELSGRAACANAQRADAFVSLHCNASNSAAACGAWVIHCQGSARGRALASAVYDELLRGCEDMCAGSPVSPPVYPDNSGWVGNRKLTVLRRTACPAILVELGFVTHDGDRTRLCEPGRADAVAAALAIGVEEWHRLESVT